MNANNQAPASGAAPQQMLCVAHPDEHGAMGRNKLQHAGEQPLPSHSEQLCSFTKAKPPKHFISF